MNEDMEALLQREAEPAEETAPKRKRKPTTQTYDDLRDTQKRYRDRLKEEGYKRLSVQMSGQEFTLLKNAVSVSGLPMREYLVSRAEEDGPGDYPNLRRIAETAKKAALFKAKEDKAFPNGYDRINLSVEVFPQEWSTAAGGMDEPGALSLRAVTTVYTTVATVQVTGKAPAVEENGRKEIKKTYYMVFFRNTGAYILADPMPAFFEDLKDRHMLGKWEALHTDRYSKETEE